MVEVEIPPSLFEEQGRQLYGAQLLQIQVRLDLNLTDNYVRIVVILRGTDTHFSLFRLI